MPNYQKVVLILLSLYIFQGISIAENQNLSQGFGDIAWGTQADTRKNLKKVAGNTEVIYYTCTEDPYEIFGEDLGRVIYGFYQGRLFSASLDIAGKEKFDKTLKGLKEEFGAPRAQYRVDKDIYIWTAAKIKIKLKHFGSRQIHKLVFYYTPISSQLNESQTSSAEEMILKLPAP